MPGFNLKGKEKISSGFGGLITVILLTVCCLYASIKLNMLVSRQNPNVSTFREEFVLTSDDKLNLKEAGMRFAWTFEGYDYKELKNDPRYVKQLVRMSGRNNGE